jgi:hypothetical protein
MKTSHGMVMDGFVKSSGSGSSQPKVHKITEATNLITPKVSNAASTRLRSAAQGVHNRAQRSQTLMRTAVKKPTAVAKAASTQFKQPDFKARLQIDKARFNRVNTIDKNTKVRRFGHGVNPASIMAKQTPQSHIAQKAEEGEVVSRQPATASATTSTGSSLIHKPLPSMVTSASHQQLERLLDEALTRANSHKRSRPGQAPSHSLWSKILMAPRWLSIGTTLVVAGLLFGFIAINKIPQVAVRVASAKAHTSAGLPSYIPSGFSYASPVNYTNGNVNIKFKANDGSNREFTLSQASSKMSSKSLEDKVIPANTQVQTSVVNGTTVYIYGQNNDAAWVNNGTQYTIKDSAKLNSDQLLKIANSL